MKNKYKTKAYVYIVIIALLLALSTYLIIENRLTLYPSPTKHTLIGSNISINAISNGSNVGYLTFDGSYLNNDKYSQNIKIIIPNNIEQSILRVSAYVAEKDGTRFESILETSSYWVYEEGYYYYQQKVKGGELINLTKYISIPQGEFDNQSFYNIAVVVEMFSYNENTLESVLSNTPDDLKIIWAS